MHRQITCIILIMLVSVLISSLSSSIHIAYSEFTNTCTLILSPGNFTTGIKEAPNGSIVCLLPDLYFVNSSLDIANKTLTLLGLGVNPSSVRIIFTSGSLKLAPSENDTVIIRNLSVETLTSDPAIQIYWSGKKGVRYDIGSVLLDNLLVNATQAIATSVQVGPDVKLKSFELRNSVIMAGKIGVQIGPNSTVTGVIVVKNNTILAGEIGIQVGPSTQVAEYLEISRNNITADIIGIQIGPPTGSSQAPPSIGRLLVVRNNITSNSSNVLEIRSIIRDYAQIYLNTFMGNGSKVSLNIDTNLIPLNKIVFNTPDKVTYFYNGRVFNNYLGNYFIDWTRPDNDVDGIVDYPRIITSEYKDNYPLADPSILSYLEQSWFIGPSEEIRVVMGGGVLVDLELESYILLVLGAFLFIITKLFKVF